MRCTGTGDRAASEQRTAKVCTATARARNDPPGRMVERCEPLRQDSRLVQHLERVIVTGDVELVARRALERVLPVGADLGPDAEVAEQAERAAGNGGARHVQVDRDLPAAAEVHAAGRVEQARELSEPVAIAARRDRGELVPEIVRA